MSAREILKHLVAQHTGTEFTLAQRAQIDQRVAAVRWLAEIMGVELTLDFAMSAMFGSIAHQAILIQEGVGNEVIDVDPGRIVAEVGLVQVALSQIIDQLEGAQP